MKLPAELRFEIYSLALSSHTTPRDHSVWATHGPKGSMNLLLSCRRVYIEAREVAYQNGSITMAIAIPNWSYWNRQSWGELFEAIGLRGRYRDFRPLPSIHHIKHWQLDLRFRSPLGTLRMHEIYAEILTVVELNQLFIGERILEAVAELAKLSDLQSLKVKFPCLCRLWRYPYFQYTGVASKDISRLMHKVLEPLNALKFQQSVTFVAAKPKDGAPDQTETAQCQEPGCIKFVACFTDLKGFLESSQPRRSFSPQQVRWLDIKHRAAEVRLYDRDEIRASLFRLWKLTEWNWDVFAKGCRKSRDVRQREFSTEYKAVCKGFKAAKKDWQCVHLDRGLQMLECEEWNRQWQLRNR